MRQQQIWLTFLLCFKRPELSHFGFSIDILARILKHTGLRKDHEFIPKDDGTSDEDDETSDEDEDEDDEGPWTVCTRGAACPGSGVAQEVDDEQQHVASYDGEPRYVASRASARKIMESIEKAGLVKPDHMTWRRFVYTIELYDRVRLGRAVFPDERVEDRVQLESWWIRHGDTNFENDEIAAFMD